MSPEAGWNIRNRQYYQTMFVVTQENPTIEPMQLALFNSTQQSEMPVFGS